MSKKYKTKCKQRDKYMCQVCGSRENLTAHHILSEYKYPELKSDLKNLVCLCKYCHEYIHYILLEHHPADCDLSTLIKLFEIKGNKHKLYKRKTMIRLLKEYNKKDDQDET